MPEITIGPLEINQESYFTFKEPVNTHLKNKYNLDSLTIKLKVVSIISMRDTLRNDLRDPYTEIYAPAGISEVDYKKDLIDHISIISFSYTDIQNIERFIRVPLNYIDSVANLTNVEYINKIIAIDLNKLPVDLDTTLFFTDLSDFISSRLGITPQIKEIGIGNILLVTPIEHTTRETVRTNAITVFKTLSTQLAETNLKHDQLLLRLQALNISLA